MLRVLKWVILLAVGLFIAGQLVRPARTNPSVDPGLAIENQMQLDPKVAAILDRSCSDCHSNKTVWPWYSNVAPVSWFVINDVNEGRQHLSLSEWGKYDQNRRRVKLTEICDMVKSGAMPLSSYTVIHRGSKLTQDDVGLLCNWTVSERTK